MECIKAKNQMPSPERKMIKSKIGRRTPSLGPRRGEGPLDAGHTKPVNQKDTISIQREKGGSMGRVLVQEQGTMACLTLPQ